MNMEHSGRKGAEGSTKPLILSEGLLLVPTKLVTRILRGDFIDTGELLHDNLRVLNINVQECSVTLPVRGPRPQLGAMF